MNMFRLFLLVVAVLVSASSAFADTADGAYKGTLAGGGANCHNGGAVVLIVDHNTIRNAFDQDRSHAVSLDSEGKFNNLKSPSSLFPGSSVIVGGQISGTKIQNGTLRTEGGRFECTYVIIPAPSP